MKQVTLPNSAQVMTAFILCQLISNGVALAQEELKTGVAKHAARIDRHAALQRQRRIIMNNDGCDCLYFPKNQKVTAEAFLAQRTTPLAGTQVDTIAYCTISSGFSFFTHNTRAGTLLQRQGGDFGILPNMRNIAPDLVARQTDPLRLVLAFAHRHHMEAFWSMRMNDTHDVAHTPKKPYFLFPPLKEEHPQWLVGNWNKRTPYGRWSSVDYARPEVRELAFRYIEEVCQNYDIDGIELDFFRHLCYFKNTANGGKATPEQLDMMTRLLQRVRVMVAQVEKKRGRPLLIAVRVPDSVDYCRDLGLDLRRWLEEKLVDILITTGYFRLNPWTYSVALGHKHGVAVYPCLSDSRVIGETRFRRSSLESYRGRAMNAWAAGADGIHLFNYFNPDAPLWNECGDPATLSELDKLYFVTVRDGSPDAFLAGGSQYRTATILTPSHATTLQVGQPQAFPLTIGDDFATRGKAEIKPNVTLHVECPSVVDTKSLQVRLNETNLASPVCKNGWFDFPVDPAIVKRGSNAVELTLAQSPSETSRWNVKYAGAALPKSPWHKDPGSKDTRQELVAGGLRIVDQGTVSGDYLYYRYPWGVAPNSKVVIEARLKAVVGNNYIIFSNGASGERLRIAPRFIQLYHHPNLRYDMDTTSHFHAFRIVLDGEDLEVFVDGIPRLRAPKALAPRRGYNRSELAFGAANSSDVGEGIWSYVKARTANATVRDIVMSVRFEK